jgi:UDP-glucose 4-epimerase
VVNDNNAIERKLVLVTGATGAIGPGVVSALHQAGYRIRAFSIDEPSAGLFPAGVEVINGDITDNIAIQTAMRGVDSVIHMAALLHIVNPTIYMREKFELVNIDGTAKVVEAAIKVGAERIILFSTIAVYGNTGGCIYDERSPVQPKTFYAQTKLAAEKIVLSAKSADGQPLGVVLRLGTVYGPRIKGNYERLVHALKKSNFIPIGNGLNRRTLVYDKDVVCAAILTVSHPAAVGRIFNVTDGTFHTMNEIIECICYALGRKPPQLLLPLKPMYVLAGIIEKVSCAIRLTPLATREMIDKYTEDVAIDGSLIQRELGFIPKYDLKTGWQETIREMSDETAI